MPPAGQGAQHQQGSLLGDRSTRFLMRCEEGSWAAARIGSEHGWYAPTPDQLPGQDGELTETLAVAIRDDLISSYGTHRMRLLTAGNERERGRLFLLRAMTTTPGQPPTWEGLAALKLRRESDSQVIAEGYDAAGSPTGERLLFVREGGLWRIADHTEDGTWAPAPHQVAGPRSIDFEIQLLGLGLGDQLHKLVDAQLLPSINNGGAPSPLITARGLSFDANRGISKVEARSGSTQRGMQVGDPMSLARALYGEPTEVTSEAWRYVGSMQQLEIRIVQDADGVDRAASFRLQRNR